MQKTFSDFGIDLPADFIGEKSATCPECSPTRKKKNVKCLSGNSDKGVWNCLHCGFSGTLKQGVEYKGESKSYKTYRKPVFKLTDLPDKVISYFKERKISEKTLKAMNISSGKTYFPQIEDYSNAIQFPYYRSGNVVNIKHRDGKKNFRMEKNAERILYNYDNAVDQLVLIIVEGEIDALSFMEAGFKNCVSVPDGAPSLKAKNYEKKFDFLENCEEMFDNKNKIYLAVDNDGPGIKLREELARRLGQERCLIVDWPNNHKDSNEVLVKCGKDALRKCINDARHYPVDGLLTLVDFEDKLDVLFEQGYQRGLNLGWENLNELYTVREGEWTLVTGIPGHGKSQWLDNVMIRMTEHHGWMFGIFSPENQPLERHAAKLIEIYTQDSFSEDTYGPRMTREKYDCAKLFIEENFNFILPCKDGQWSLDSILELARIAVFRKGIKGVVIDPWNEMEHNRPKSLNETEYISECLSKIRKFARQYSVHVWLVAHPTKLQKNRNGNYPVPTPYDVSGSANWKNKADNAISVWRNVLERDQPVEIHVQKIRFKDVGKVGLAKLNYDINTGIYTDNHDYREEL